MRYKRTLLLNYTAIIILLISTGFSQLSFSDNLASPSEDLVETKAKASTVRITGGNFSRMYAGSGFFIEPDKIVTNLHVVNQSGVIFAKQDDNETIWTVVGVNAYDMKNDLVILKISGTGTPLSLADSDTLNVGDVIYASGYPGGGIYKFTKGEIHNSKDRDNLLQTTALISSGSSGGPMLNSDAEVVGISVGSGDTYTYAISSNSLKALLTKDKGTTPLMQWYKQDSVRGYSLYQQGKARYTMKDYAGAIVEFSKSIEFAPEFGESYKFRAHMYTKMGETEAEQGRMFIAREYFQDSIADYTIAINLEPDEDSVYNYRGHVYSHYGEAEVERENANAAQGNFEASIVDYNKAILVDPQDDANYAGRGWAKYLLGQLYSEQGDKVKSQKLYQESIIDFNEAIKLNPQEGESYNGRGWAEYLFGQMNSKHGDDVEAEKHYQAAIIDSNKAIELNSEAAHFYHTRGAVKAALGQYNNAIENFDKSLEIDSDYRKAYNDRGHAKVALGQHDAAKADFLKARQSIGQGAVSTEEIEKAAEDMVRIPAGEFQMGSQTYAAEQIHTVYLDAYYIDAFEVTNAQFKVFIDANPQWSKSQIQRIFHNGRYLRLWNGDEFPKGKGNHPVVYVSWYAAMAYADWVNKRLPTEAEWEKAARGGIVGQRYVWGDLPDPKKSNYGYYDTNTLSVGSYLPNGYGLYDMGGNVWEFCLDQYDKGFYRRSPKKNPFCDDVGIDEVLEKYLSITSRRVSRGGSWNTPGPARTSVRGNDMPSNTNSWLGFRCAKSIPEPIRLK